MPACQSLFRMQCRVLHPETGERKRRTIMQSHQNRLLDACFRRLSLRMFWSLWLHSVSTLWSKLRNSGGWSRRLSTADSCVPRSTPELYAEKSLQELAHWGQHFFSLSRTAVPDWDFSILHLSRWISGNLNQTRQKFIEFDLGMRASKTRAFSRLKEGKGIDGRTL